MKKWLLRAVDAFAFAVVGVVVLAFTGAVCLGLWYMARGIFRYLTSWEGQGLLFGLGLALTVCAAVTWLRHRYDRPEHPCAVCGKPAVGMRTSDRTLLCAYHAGER